MSHTSLGSSPDRSRKFAVGAVVLVVLVVTVVLVLVLISHQGSSDASESTPSVSASAFNSHAAGTIGYGTPAAEIAAAVGCIDVSEAPSPNGSNLIAVPGVVLPTTSVTCSMNGVKVSISGYATEQLQVSASAASARLAGHFGGSMYATGEGWSASLFDPHSIVASQTDTGGTLQSIVDRIGGSIVVIPASAAS